MHVPAWHPASHEVPGEEGKLVTLEVELVERPQPVLVQRVPGVPEPGEMVEGLLNVGFLVPLLDLDQERGQAAAQRGVPAPQDGELVPLDVTLDERHRRSADRQQ